MLTNILEYLEQTVTWLPEKAAFLGEGERLTFRQLYCQARAMGSRLLADGFGGQPVLVFMKKRPGAISAFLGAVYAGCCYVPLDDSIPRQRLEQIVEAVKPGACICDEDTLEAAQGMGLRLYSWWEVAAGPIDEAGLRAVRDNQIDTDPVYIVFTSGSTGMPKGVTGSHRAVIDYIENLCQVLKFREDTVFGSQAPLYFDACLKEILPTLKYGASTYLIPRRLFSFPVKLVEYLNEHRINTVCWVVSALTGISSLGALDQVKPQYLHTIAFAGEVFPIRQLNLWRKALPNARFLNLYGPTETTGICCYYEVDREFEEGEALPVGRPFRNTRILLVDEAGQVPPRGQPGEICIQGTRLTLGYYGDAERTGAVFVQNPLHDRYPDPVYRTGDMGSYNSRGELVFLGRRDHQVKHMGHRIELGEIEAAACSHRAVRGAGCVFVEGKLFLYYAGNLAERELAFWLKERLPRYLCPHVLKKLEAMPLTPNGKTDRNDLKKRSMHYGKNTGDSAGTLPGGGF